MGIEKMAARQNAGGTWTSGKNAPAANLFFLITPERRRTSFYFPRANFSHQMLQK
jgi:hypothetical protein